MTGGLNSGESGAFGKFETNLQCVLLFDFCFGFCFCFGFLFWFGLSTNAGKFKSKFLAPIPLLKLLPPPLQLQLFLQPDLLHLLPSPSPTTPLRFFRGMQGYREEQFDLKFSELPPMFKACDDPPIATVVHPLAQAPLPKAALQPKNVRASIHNCSSVL